MPVLLRRPSWAEAQFVARALRTETVGGVLLLLAAAVALLWANSPWHASYAGLRDLPVGIEWAHLRLSLGQWAADGLLAVFFMVAGLELKREFLVGDLDSPRKALVPVVAAACGVAVPAALYVGIVGVGGADAAAARGWAVPTATDIAFALGVLAIIGSHLPSTLRSFLLTLAVVDDLIAIAIIAIAYTSDLRVVPLLLAAIPLAGFAALAQRRVARWYLLLPFALATWALVHASGVHATVAGILLGVVVPVRPGRGARLLPALSNADPTEDLAHRLEHRLRPLSAGLCVPVFAFFASGVAVIGPGAEGGGLGAAVGDPVVVAVVVALVIGKPVGVLGSTWLLSRLVPTATEDRIAWSDVVGLALLTGVGFTVSLLIGDLAFGAGSPRAGRVTLAVLAASVISTALAAAVLIPRNAVHRRMASEGETGDRDPGT